MRRVVRSCLDPAVESKLQERQTEAIRQHSLGTLHVNREWSNARKTRPLKAVAGTLKAMMGLRERCMYCLDSHGTDIDHFWPKTTYPERMFVWPNLMLSCTECGRLKGSRFPLIAGQPALVDPTAEDPWEFLDFDPTTGNVVARFNVKDNDWSERGVETVELLQLDKREALSEAHKKTLRRLSKIVERALVNGVLDSTFLLRELRDADDHGLLEWCFLGSGQRIMPFSDLRTNHEPAWSECLGQLRSTP